ncbi:MAG: ABC transporter permease [Ruminiclostridium sp.]|jgi:putative ABC transport system permease protein|nr:ABC transporter permease [Ruminiclostridium sp.]
MKHFSQVYATLRRHNRKQYALLAGCCFFSVLLITAYVCMMRSPTILTVLPEGGDSRKQVMMVFVLAVIGCAVFTTYAAALFLRQKSRENGIFLALGASRKQVQGELFRELGVISVGACALGAALGAPLAWLLWKVFRLCVVDTEEMALRFDPQAYLLALAFSGFVILVTFLLGHRSVRRTNIIDIVQESHKSEPIRDVPRRYGLLGILLVVIGGVLGYMAPNFFILKLRWYPPEGLMSLFYLPALVGLYMLLLHTVVNGWGGRRRQYKDLISTSMMKFQGRQTVRNMLVMTLLIAGAYFGSFYSPMMGSSSLIGYASRPVDYAYHFRADQDIPQGQEVQEMAAESGVEITRYAQVTMARLGFDGTYGVETEGPMGVTIKDEYLELLNSQPFLSVSDYNTLTGEALRLQPGQVAGIVDPINGTGGMFNPYITIVTNPITGERLSVEAVEPVAYQPLFGYYILNDQDMARLSEGLPLDWQEEMVVFDVANCDDTYYFAKELYYRIVDRSGPEVELVDSWDPVVRAREIQEKGRYDMDPENVQEYTGADVDYDKRDSSSFRLYWQYMPQFRVLDQTEFLRTMAVFILLFVFVAIVCFAAVIIIAYTRCMTIALTNRKVYDDLRHLGAPRKYLYQSVRGQVKRVFLTPTLVGTILIYAFYILIMLFNGDSVEISLPEAVGLLASLGLIAAVSLLLYGVYRMSLKRVCDALDVQRPGKKQRA